MKPRLCGRARAMKQSTQWTGRGSDGGGGGGSDGRTLHVSRENSHKFLSINLIASVYLPVATGRHRIGCCQARSSNTSWSCCKPNSRLNCSAHIHPINWIDTTSFALAKSGTVSRGSSNRRYSMTHNAGICAADMAEPKTHEQTHTWCRRCCRNTSIKYSKYADKTICSWLYLWVVRQTMSDVCSQHCWPTHAKRHRSTCQEWHITSYMFCIVDAQLFVLFDN